MTPRTLTCALLALSTTLSAQNLLVGDPGPLGFSESQGNSPLTPGGVPVAPFPALFPLPPGPPGPTPSGGVTFDGTTGLIWHSDGILVAAEPHPMFLPAYTGAPLPPTPLPGVIGLPITGMAADPGAGLLWITDGFSVVGLGLGPGTPVATPPFTPGFQLQIPLGGIDFDPLTGVLWGVDLSGVAFPFFPGGAPAGIPVPPPVPFSPTSPAAGIAIDKTGAFGPTRPLYVMGPSVIVDYSTGAVWPNFAGGAGAENGLTFLQVPSAAPPFGLCACPGMPFSQFVRGPMTTTNGSFGIDLMGLPPNHPVFFAFDFTGFNPAFPVVNGLGCGLGMTVAGIFGINVNADAAGTASASFSLIGVPVGTRVYMQQIMPCATDPIGLVLTPMHQVIVSAP